MGITVYTTGPACNKCNLTKSQLSKAGLAFTEVRIDEDPAAREMLLARGYSVAPVVHVAATDDWWGDFRIDKIRELKKQACIAA
jgi:glutaredoxin-like protein NrdH